MRSALVVALCVLLHSGARAATPCNPNAMPKVKQILDYLEGLPGRTDKRVLSGQNVGHIYSLPDGYTKYIVDLHSKTQKWVALIGVDYGFSLDPGDMATVNQTLKDYWKAGGLVTISAHFNNPFNGNDSWDTNGVNLTQLITAGTTANQTWMGFLDKVATGLAELRDAGVVVLWRPLHEMNGNWFWWSFQGSVSAPQDELISVWKHMFSYFTSTKKLNNLIWVYGPNVQTDPASTKATAYYYPGKDFVDVVGLDIYQNDLSKLNANGSYDSLVALGKPFGLTEFGPKNLLDGSFDTTLIIKGIKTYGPKATFWLSWHSWTDAKVAIVDNQNATALLSDPWVITRELLNFGGPAATDAGGGPPPAPPPGEAGATGKDSGPRAPDRSPAEGAAPDRAGPGGCGCFCAPRDPATRIAGTVFLCVVLLLVLGRGRASS